MQKREGIMRKLFLLEDDLSLISGLTFAFKKQGFALDTALQACLLPCNMEQDIRRITM